MKQELNIFWFKRDLRLIDNDAFFSAFSCNLPVLLLYILEPSLVNDRHYSYRHWQFVKASLEDLNYSLSTFNTKIHVLNLEVEQAFDKIRNEYDINTIFSTEETGLNITFQRDIHFSKYCQKNGMNWMEFQNGGFIRGMKNRDTWRKSWYDYMAMPIEKPNLKNAKFLNNSNFENYSEYFLFKGIPNEEDNMQLGGRTEGLKWMESFFSERLSMYSDYISKPEMARYGCSRLSPYIAWGCLSIREIYQRCILEEKTSKFKKQLNAFMSRLRWQAHFIQKFEMESRIEFEAFNKGYLNFEQLKNTEYIKAWKSGGTGYPLVDASIRAVKETGYLNFRMRSMIVSFLMHHLFQHFSMGSVWLARQFLDFEPGIHYGQFQMQSGFTATNTIRIYNPTKNALDHDSEAVFIKKYVPELKHLPIEFAIQPWLMTPMEEVLYDFKLGKDYPNRIVDINETRKVALQKLYAQRKDKLTISEKDRILKTHTLKRRFL